MELEPEELHLHTKVALILSDTDNIYTKSDLSDLDNFFDQIDTIAVELQNMVSTIPSFIKLSKPLTTVTTYNTFTNNKEDETSKNNYLALNMDTAYESQFNDIFENIATLSTASTDFNTLTLIILTSIANFLAFFNHNLQILKPLEVFLLTVFLRLHQDLALEIFLSSKLSFQSQLVFCLTLI